MNTNSHQHQNIQIGLKQASRPRRKRPIQHTLLCKNQRNFQHKENHQTLWNLNEVTTYEDQLVKFRPWISCICPVLTGNKKMFSKSNLNTLCIKHSHTAVFTSLLIFLYKIVQFFILLNSLFM